jgi:GNAT superfamily N-acetyltransferase
MTDMTQAAHTALGTLNRHEGKQPLHPEWLSLRPIDEHDHPFLLELYASTREVELAPLDWSDAQKQQFLVMQFEAQHRHYQQHYPTASFDLILYAGDAIGRLYLDEWEDQWRVVDIALLPAYCGQGIGSHWLQDVIQRAALVGKAVSIHVEQHNPALRLYQRLGFEQVDTKGVYLLMEWRVANPAQIAPVKIPGSSLST